ncbi:MAG: aminotransferase class V-fold PLP-dependent enzyme [Ignavibacteriaceae bacterium]|nr:aminotransferase class V-fold PLP-dependent enzyme [Ignavibacteriaceae bacterium]
MDIEKFRKEFPHISKGKVFLNHAAIGPVSNRVVAGVNSFLKRRSEEEIDDYGLVLSDLKVSRRKIGKLINCSENRIAFFDNSPTGLNVLSSGLVWKEGDRILIDDTEFPSNIYPLLNLRKKGVEIDYVVASEKYATAAEVIASIKPGTKLLYFSAVQFLSGYRIDIKKIGEYCKDNNIIFCVDGNQAVGAIKIDVEENHIDFLSCVAQKWLMGLMGLSFVYIREELQSKINYDNYGYVVEPGISFLDFEINSITSADSLQTGVVNVVGVHALNSAIDLLNEAGIEIVEEKIIQNSLYLSEKIESLGIETSINGQSNKNIAGIVSFYSPNAKAIYNALTLNKFYCSLREGLVRLSPHFYNIKDELDEAAKIIKTAI